MDLRDILLSKLHLEPDACFGKVVVVTGAGRGIGRRAADAFALLGASVAIAEISEQGQAAAEAICQAGGKAAFVQTDISSADSVRRMVEAVHQLFGPVDILVNNAIRIAVAPVSEMEDSLWDSILAVNLRGTFLTCKALLPEMIKRRQGVIINMVSTEAMPGLSAYIASKQGILGFTQSLALEAGLFGVKVIPFGPGMVDTPGIRSVSEDLAPRLGLSQEQFLNVSLHPAYNGLMPPEHAGAAAVYLALRLTDTYHGQQVTGYEVLEQAGLIEATPVELPLDSQQPVRSHTQVNLENILRLAGEVREIVAETGREFEKLPAFVRPLARSGFKGKTGASLNDWERELASLQPAGIAEKSRTLPPRLEKLIVYYQGVPSETARFTKDRAMLDEIARVCADRIRTVQDLIGALRSVEP